MIRLNLNTAQEEGDIVGLHHNSLKDPKYLSPGQDHPRRDYEKTEKLADGLNENGTRHDRTWSENDYTLKNKRNK